MLWDKVLIFSKKQLVDPKQVLREQLQKTILTILSQKGYFNKIVFQGGTALRLCYGNPRFSEDLDFSLNKKQDKINIELPSSTITRSILDTYPFLEKATFTTQKISEQLQLYVLSTQGTEPSQKSRIHLELASIPSYDNQPMILNFPPFNPAIQVETKKEILADKITALGCRTYIKGRDLWDIYFLFHEQNIDIDLMLVRKKIADYNVSKKGYLDQIKQRSDELKQIGTSLLSFELKRFLPQNIYAQYEDQFSSIIHTIIKNIPSENSLFNTEG